MKSLTATLAALALAATAFFVGAPAQAQAPEKVDVSNGLRWTPKLDIPDSQYGWCTIAAVGKDSQNRSVALTAGHCTESYPAGSPVYLKDRPEAGIIGTVSTSRSAVVGLDYLVLLLDDSKVNLKSNGPTARIDHVETRNLNPAGIFFLGGDTVCKHGTTTGKTCGKVTGFGNGSVYSTLFAFSGDSGSGWTVGPQHTGLVGITRGLDLGVNGGVGTYATHIKAVLDHLDTTPGAPGQGFVATNN